MKINSLIIYLSSIILSFLLGLTLVKKSVFCDNFYDFKFIEIITIIADVFVVAIIGFIVSNSLAKSSKREDILLLILKDIEDDFDELKRASKTLLMTSTHQAQNDIVRIIDRIQIRLGTILKEEISEVLKDDVKEIAKQTIKLKRILSSHAASKAFVKSMNKDLIDRKFTLVFSKLVSAKLNTIK